MAKKSVAGIVSGAGMFMSLITMLVDEVKSAGGCVEDIHRLVTSGGVDTLRRVARIIVEAGKNACGQAVAVVKILQAEIDTDLDPRLPFNGTKIEKHVRVGKVRIEKRHDGLYVGGKKVVLYHSKRQLNGKTIVGHELRTELDGQLVLSAIILDFLLAHPEYIPEEWKQDESGNTISIYFWGTIYRYSDDDLCVRYLSWFGHRWREDCYWLVSGWDFQNPAAVLASISTLDLAS